MAAVLLLADTPLRLPGLRIRIATLLLLAVAVSFVPLPYNAVVTLLLVGTAASLAPIPSRWLPRLSRGAIAAGAILLSQSLALLAYQTMTARAHELPWFFAELIAGLAHMLGADVTVDSATLVLRNAQTTIRVAATWELLLAPGTVCFVAGGLVLLALRTHRRRHGSTHRKSLLRSVLALVILSAVWALWRAVLLVTLVLQQQLRHGHHVSECWRNADQHLGSYWLGAGVGRTGRSSRPAASFSVVSKCGRAAARSAASVPFLATVGGGNSLPSGRRDPDLSLFLGTGRSAQSGEN